jgi:hypothetical protein
MKTADVVPEQCTQNIEGDALYAQLLAEAMAASSLVGPLVRLVRAV